MNKSSLEFVSVLSTGLGLLLLSTIQVSAQPLVPSSPTGTLTDGVNISINPEEPLPANGTVSISTEGATDTDMNVIPPEGVSVVISNDTITVTNQTVDIETADEDEDGSETEEDEEPEENGANGGGDEGGDEGGDDGGDGEGNEDNSDDNDNGPVNFGPDGPVD
jgi:hypothetical protein